MASYTSFDMEVAMERSGGGEERFFEMAAFFPSYCEELVLAVESAMQEKNFEQLKKAAHKLKGSLGMVGAKEAFDSAMMLEKRALEEEGSKLEERVTKLKKDVSLLLNDLRNLTRKN